MCAITVEVREMKQIKNRLAIATLTTTTAINASAVLVIGKAALDRPLDKHNGRSILRGRLIELGGGEA